MQTFGMNLDPVADNFYRPDLKKAALAMVSVGHRSLKVSKSGVKKRNRQVVKTPGSKHIEQKAVEKLSTKSSRETINGKEIDLEELEGRLDQAQIQKTYISISGEDASSFYYVHLVKCKI
ncbi:ubiquitin-specific protease 5 [Prunus dulcis]|uniref:Ubiquitin-specific protease 5 n=1 Tax=Prunus dulcis TaxID=3755 RepID=A0A4Y1RDN0_PRUDU|nr:ubiquitin-specific protease 5 [Prunus dulcis]